jgi:hypothetical protein
MLICKAGSHFDLVDQPVSEVTEQWQLNSMTFHSLRIGGGRHYFITIAATPQFAVAAIARWWLESYFFTSPKSARPAPTSCSK